MSTIDALHLLERAKKILDPTPCDEVAILFDTLRELEKFVADCEEHGANLFNSVARDTMRRQDAGGTFDVSFRFLHWGDPTWRIEAMCVLGGSAPLHEDVLRRHGSGTPIHVSYKLSNLHSYQQEVRQLASERARLRAEYINTYGVFSYWKHYENIPLPEPQMFLKPRVNLRDS